MRPCQLAMTCSTLLVVVIAKSSCNGASLMPTSIANAPVTTLAEVESEDVRVEFLQTGMTRKQVIDALGDREGEKEKRRTFGSNPLDFWPDAASGFEGEDALARLNIAGSASPQMHDETSQLAAPIGQSQFLSRRALVPRHDWLQLLSRRDRAPATAPPTADGTSSNSVADAIQRPAKDIQEFVKSDTSLGIVAILELIGLVFLVYKYSLTKFSATLGISRSFKDIFGTEQETYDDPLVLCFKDFDETCEAFCVKMRCMGASRDDDVDMVSEAPCTYIVANCIEGLCCCCCNCNFAVYVILFVVSNILGYIIVKMAKLGMLASMLGPLASYAMIGVLAAIVLFVVFLQVYLIIIYHCGNMSQLFVTIQANTVGKFNQLYEHVDDVLDAIGLSAESEDEERHAAVWDLINKGGLNRKDEKLRDMNFLDEHWKKMGPKRSKVAMKWVRESIPQQKIAYKKQEMRGNPIVNRFKSKPKPGMSPPYFYKGQATLNFKGEIGLVYDESGNVEKATKGMQASKKGVEAGFLILKVNDQAFSKDALLEAEKSGRNFKVTFQTQQD